MGQMFRVTEEFTFRSPGNPPRTVRVTTGLFANHARALDEYQRLRRYHPETKAEIEEVG